jgi:hypothetical protein
VSRSRVISGAMIVAGSVFASSLFAGGAAAQYEPVGKPLQLLPPSYTGKSAATPRSRVAAKKAAKTEPKSENKSEMKFAAKSETKQHVSFRRKHRPHIEVAEQKRPQRAVADAPEVSPTVAAMAFAATTPAAPPRPRSRPTPPPSVQAPTQSATGELVVGGQTVQVRSPDEANEIDLAANEPSAPASAAASAPTNAAAGAPPTSDAPAPANSAALYNLASANPPAASESAPVGAAAPAQQADPAPAAAMSPPKGSLGSMSWLMQIMAALGGAIAAGSAAWFLIGSTSSRIRLSE